MSDERAKDDNEPPTGSDEGAAQTLARAMSRLAQGAVAPPGKPMSAIELSELRALMATGTYKPATGAAIGASASSGSTPNGGAPLAAADIATIKTMMLVKPYVPHPMPSAAGAVPETDDVEAALTEKRSEPEA